MLTQFRKALRRFARGDAGTQMIEFAIVFPVLILLFAGIIELGRLLQTYTTLAKSTRSAARYLSMVQNVTNSSGAARNIVLCGSAAGCGGQNQPPITIPGLTAANVVITPPVAGTAPVKYVRVEITGYTYRPAIFNLNAMTGSTFNFTLNPSTRMRYMPN